LLIPYCGENQEWTRFGSEGQYPEP
jgi:hypothetical protein